MIKEGIQFIADVIESMNLFEKVYSQVELVIDSEGKIVPALYISKGK